MGAVRPVSPARRPKVTPTGKPAAQPRAKKAKPKTVKDKRTSQPRYAAAAAMRSEVLRLRTEGMTMDQIAAQVGRSKSVVHNHLKNALEELDGEQREASDRMRALAYARLERILATAMTGAIKGDVKCMREAQRLILAQGRIMGWAQLQLKNPETGEVIGDGEGAPAARWTLPGRLDVSMPDWQEAAEIVWLQQQQNAEAQDA